MVGYRLIKTKDFYISFNKLPKEMKRRFIKQIEKLKIDPFSIGKPIGSKCIRETKNKGYRLYYRKVEPKTISFRL